MSALSIVLIAIIALLAGMEGILDEFQFHQPLVACTLIVSCPATCRRASCSAAPCR